MFQIINITTGETFDVEKPRFVRKNSNGVYIRTDEDAATAVAVAGKLYPLFDDEDPADNAVIIREIDGGGQIQNVLRENLLHAQTLEEVKRAIIDIYDCLLDFYELEGED